MDDTQDSILKLFGFEIKRSKKQENEESKLKSVVPPTDEDGEGYVTVSGLNGGFYGQYLNTGGEPAKDSKEQIMRYRGASMHPEVDAAVEEITNEAISASELTSSVEISMEDAEISDKIKKQITEEFDNVVAMLKFNEIGHEIFRSWYIDGRIVHHLLVDEKNLKAGIQEIRHIDSTKIRKHKQVKYKKDEKTGVDIVDKVTEYYIYDDKKAKSAGPVKQSVKISTEAISYVTSGLMDESRVKVLSHLHKSLKTLNMLKMMEDALLIYRLSRAPERRLFYIDVGNMPTGKAEEYMKGIMTRYRNKLVYDATTGQIKDDRKHMSMLEDFWLPRREGGRGTEVSNLPGGQNLGEIEDIEYFQRKLYRSMNVPLNRLEQESQFTLGRSTEITRDELKFQKFIDRLRRRFSKVFLDILKKQLVLKNIITEEDWEDWKNDIQVSYVRDNHFTELKELEIIRERVGVLNEISAFVGEFYTKEWIMRNVLRFNDEELKQMQNDLEKEEPLDVEEKEDVPVEKEPPKAPQKKEEPKETNDEDDLSKALDTAVKDTQEHYQPTAKEELYESMINFLNNEQS